MTYNNVVHHKQIFIFQKWGSLQNPFDLKVSVIGQKLQ
jgi:hypothetical protein